MFGSQYQLPTSFTLAKPKATGSALFAAGIDQMHYDDNSNSGWEALGEAIRRRVDDVYKATGVRLENPFYGMEESEEAPLTQEPPQFVDPAEQMAKALRDFNGQLSKLGTERPELSSIIRPSIPIEEDAYRIAKEADDRFSSLLESRDDLTKWAFAFAGSAVGAAYDPLQWMTLFLGGGAGGARTIAGKIAATAFSEAFVNGAVEAALQPAVQDWRQKAGLPAGFDEAMANVGFAAAFGGVLGGGMRGAGELIGKLGAKLPERTQRAMGGDGAAAAEALRELPAATLKPETRGALKAVDAEEFTASLQPEGVSLRHHEKTVADFALAAREGRAVDWTPDPDQVARLALMLEAETAAPPLRADTAIGRVRDPGAPNLPEFQVFMRQRILDTDPELGARLDAAEARLQTAEQNLKAVETPLAARSEADAVALVNPEAGARLKAVEAELAANPKAARRADLMRERETIVESLSPDRIAKAESDFRIGPEKATKSARQAVQTARKARNRERNRIDTLAAKAENAARIGTVVNEVLRRGGRPLNDVDALAAVKQAGEAAPPPARAADSAMPQNPPEPRADMPEPKTMPGGTEKLGPSDFGELGDDAEMPLLDGTAGTLADLKAELERGEWMETVTKACKS